ncbi:ATP-dependent RNA helicase RhlE [Alteromonas sp. MB-3u-76]|jgi:ATP-dependent RNA helicase RhlE|uniref:DEAD/DEAH box helicase n=1 Tax=unclassified Alteromonas TaxID=2614992 RepID=UPI000903F19C|nr:MULTISPECIES: DEAD/DEAH box helicase [unclassified Alteromonas]APE06660.1 ATP-dependent RNA helicase RhlE [Alteromonas sp. RW2A1]AUC89201.1 ATP-dependent RNA helicase RhlE [Alteromonas sp. MB-3u-76]
MPFSDLGLCTELLNTITDKGYVEPSSIQSKAIPVVLSQRDLIAIAQTGTGKTASFSLPILQRLVDMQRADAHCVKALIIAPTRELAAQVAANVATYGRNMNIRSTAVFGGVRIEPQKYELEQGVDILIATPGRLVDLYQQGAINFDHVEILVLDEADRMLDLGFIDHIHSIQNLLPKKRQTLLFSATFSKEIKALAATMVKTPITIELTTARDHIENITQVLHPVDKERKHELLIHLLNNNDWSQILVFTRTKRGADELRNELEALGIAAESIHANRTQQARTLALDGFRNGSLKVLIGTDLAARGIDIQQLPCVINIDLPYVPEDYIHRIGRTGRASSSGLAISLYSDDEAKQLRAIERMLGRQFKKTFISEFTPKPKPPEIKKDQKTDDLYGNFEAFDKPKGKGKSKGRRKRR